MRKQLTILAIIATLAMAAGCNAQHAITQNAVDLTVIPPPGATSTYVYVFSRVTVTGSSCPVPSTGTYTLLNDSGATASPTYTDPGATGLKVCYVAQSKDTSVSPPLYSSPSNTAGPYTVPQNPLAPSLTATPAVNSVGLVKPALGPAPTETPVKAIDRRMPAPALTAVLRMTGERP